MSFTDDMLRSFEELPRETGEGKDSGRESGRKEPEKEVSFTDGILKSFGELPREKQEKKGFGRESGWKEPENDTEILRESYGKTKRETHMEAVSASGDETGTFREEKAIRDMRRVLYFMEKKVRGVLSETDRQEIRDSMEQWADSVEVLHQYVEGQ